MKINGRYVRKNEKLLYEEVDLLRGLATLELKKRYKINSTLLENDYDNSDKKSTIKTIRELLILSAESNEHRKNYSTGDTKSFRDEINARKTVNARQKLEEKILSVKTTDLLEIFYRIRKSNVNLNRRHDPWYLEEDLDPITEEKIKYYEKQLAEEIRIDKEIEEEKSAKQTNGINKDGD